jgi:hypothetical protein
MKNKLKNILTAALLAGAALFVTSCASTGSPTAPGSATVATSGGTKSYPLKTCIVTDNDLGSMGDEQRIVYKGQEIKFCCKPCEAKFLKNPEKYLQKIR